MNKNTLKLIIVGVVVIMLIIGISLVCTPGHFYDGMLWIYISGALIVLGINYILAKEFYEVAKGKGYTHIKYFLYAFFLGIPGYLLIMVLPQK